MFRSIVLALAMASTVVTTTAAQQPASPVPSLRQAIGAEVAKISAASARPAATIRAARPIAAVPAPAARAQTAGKRSFWKSPWPYVIVGAVAVIAIVATSSEGGIY